MSVMKWTVNDIKLQIMLAGSDKDRLKYWKDRLEVLEARIQRRKDRLKVQRELAAKERKELKEADQKRNKIANKEHRKLGGLPVPLLRKLTKLELAQKELKERLTRKDELNAAGLAARAAFEAARKRG